MGKLFGTDGIRGVANKDLTGEFMFDLGRAAAYILAKDGCNKIVVGRDTRVSGDMLESALVAGICSAGLDVVKVGIIPTPAVARLIPLLEAGAGAVISASHNPVEDNGIKFFDGFGYKLDDDTEDSIEGIFKSKEKHIPRPTGLEIGRVFTETAAPRLYVDYIKDTVETDFKGLRIVVDCAYGAAWETAPMVLRELGAQVVSIHVVPDGSKINVDCGSTNTDKLSKAVIAHSADGGIAFDGDADRIIAVDEKGNILDGDFIMAICAKYLAEKGVLKNSIVVATTMSNLGLELALKESDITLLRTSVGDKHVLRKMLEEDAVIGGEQSGHIIFGDYCTTGDGIITACQLLNILLQSGSSLSELAGCMEKVPQKIINVRVEDKEAAMDDKELKRAVEEAEKEMGEEGRVVVRPSGTEPLIRVMVECLYEEKCTEIAEYLSSVINNNQKRLDR